MKVIKVLCVMLLILSMSACGVKGPTYLKEYSYLPAHDNMTIVEEAKENEGGFLEATYEVKESSYDEVLNEYEQILVKDGWKITNDQKPGIITAEKDTHQAIFIPRIDNEKLLLLVSAK
jgi:predicted small lipoprotein YifL